MILALLQWLPDVLKDVQEASKKIVFLEDVWQIATVDAVRLPSQRPGRWFYRLGCKCIRADAETGTIDKDAWLFWQEALFPDKCAIGVSQVRKNWPLRPRA